MQVKRKLMKMYFSSQRTLCSMRSTVIEVHDKSAGIYDNMSVLVENHAHEVLFGLAYEYLSGYMGSTAHARYLQEKRVCFGAMLMRSDNPKMALRE